MITIVHKQHIRQDITIPFASFVSAQVSQECADRAHEYYVLGKLVSRHEEISPDGLTLSITTVWSSEEAKAEFFSDPIIKVGLVDKYAAYNAQNGIGVVFQ